MVFLGTSASMPTQQRNLPSVYFFFYKHFLFDIGEGTQRQMMRFSLPFGSIDAIFISHLHLDHYLGLFGLLETYKLEKRDKVLHVYAPLPLKRQLRAYKFVQFHALQPGLLYEDKYLKVSAFALDHGVECYGFVVKEKAIITFDGEKAKRLGLKGRMFQDIQRNGFVETENGKVELRDVAMLRTGRKFVYATDTRPVRETEVQALGADVLIHDATFLHKDIEQAIKRKHSTAREAATLAKKADVKHLYLYHLSPRYSAQEFEHEALKVFSRTSVAYDGLTVTIPKHQPVRF